MNPIRFAPLIRVSTEKQEQQGESLKTQTKQITQYVKTLGGIVPDNCWYSGQESATPGKDRAILKQLLEDSEKGLFDAVIVCDHSRWSRDNVQSEAGLKILMENGIKFFVGSTEVNLYDPKDRFTVSLFSVINQHTKEDEEKKSIENRIARAKKNIPSAGVLPFGRFYNKKTERWGVDTDKRVLIESAARRYISGDNLKDVAASINMNRQTLFHILTVYAGTEWQLRFRNSKFNIDETVTLVIPPLLDVGVIKQVFARRDQNKTTGRGTRQYNFVLGGYVFCARCGYRLTTYMNPTGLRYYRHRTYQHNTDCDFGKVVQADKLELSVLIHLTQTLGDPIKMEEAIKRATPDMSKLHELKKELANLKKRLMTTLQQKERLVSAVATGAITLNEVSSRMEKLRLQEVSSRTRINDIENELANIPDPDKVKKATRSMGLNVFKTAMRDMGARILLKRNYTWKRNLVERAFFGKDSAGKALGVYVDYDESQAFSYAVRGDFAQTINTLPVSRMDIAEAFNIDPHYEDVEKEIDTIVHKITEQTPR